MKQPRQDIHNSEVPVLCQSCDARHRGICGALKANELIA
ncbi:Crp/Fnr family transcriptional regulator, partial [Salmonella enterica subsp. enterica]|nr:Crp/Fnr family transcriptional regulator [Salmonella enterica subsp. enterica serovar Enteritidis]